MSFDNLIAKIRESRTFRILTHIAGDLVITLLLLLSLSLIHKSLDYVAASEYFKNLFSKVHEAVFMATYLNLVVKSIIRMWTDGK